MENVVASYKRNGPPNQGKRIAILSLDGGGIRGVIAGVILEYLESKLQTIDENPDARLADYFDVISGTSTGGLMAAMLTAPNKQNRPLYAAKDIVPFYKQQCPKIFPQPWFPSISKIVRALNGPLYDGVYLRKLATSLLGNTKLRQCLTNLVIPTFDIKTLQPVIFSTFQIKDHPALDANVSDICLGTSAAPTFLPCHYFKNGVREFNLVDGGVAANNPTLVAINEVTEQIIDENPDFFPMEPQDYKRYLVLSLGTGAPKLEHGQHSAKDAATWGIIGWFVNKGAPLINIFTEASADMINFHEAVVFKAVHSEENYLRIQEDALSEDLCSMDLATDQNLNNLEKVGKKLLDKPVSRVNMKTGTYDVVVGGGTNKQALDKFAEALSEEKKLRRAKV